MTTRILPKSEWHRLAGTALGESATTLPKNAVVVIVEDDHEAIVGCWGAFLVAHVEGLWIHPDHQGKASVARRLWTKMRHVVQGFGEDGAMTASSSDVVRGLLEHVGAVKCPDDLFIVPMK